MVTNTFLAAISERRNDLAHTVKSLPMSVVKPIIAFRQRYSGGLEDIGNFAEGFCLSVLSEQETWVLCADSLEDKEEWMLAIASAKGLAQKVIEKKLEGTTTLSQGDAGGEAIEALIYKQTGPESEEIETLLHWPDEGAGGGCDGYWKELQPWSSCTLACGGGTMTHHRECVPPSCPDGKDNCKGDPIETKECNP